MLYESERIKCFEEMRTVLQELSFDEAERAFKRYKVDFSEEKYIALGLRNIHDNQYTNLAISIGGLLPGLSADDIRSGISQPRNRKLAEIFHRLRLIESYGTGIRKIYALYKDHIVQPRIEVTPNTFKLVLPNMNANAEIAEAAPATTEKTHVVMTPQMKTG